MTRIERLEQRDWRDMSSAPRDGRFVLLTWMHAGEPQEVYAMRWESDAKNGLFPGHRGFWVLLGGGMTWIEKDAFGGGPTHWADDPELAKFGGPPVRLVWSRP